MTAPHQPRQMDAGPLLPEIRSFRLHLAAEGKSVRTIKTYTEAATWFAAGCLRHRAGKSAWREADRGDVREWMAWLLGRYSDSYASNQYRALQQFFKWLATEEDVADPMAGLRPPYVAEKPVPVFTGQELARLERACAGRGFAERRDAAVIALLRASGIRLSELAEIRYDPDDMRRSDIDLPEREVTVHGKGRRTRTVKISYGAAQSLDRSLRVHARHPLAYRPELWLGASNRGALTASGIYQAAARRGRVASQPPVQRRRLAPPVPPSLQPRLARPRWPRGRSDGAERLVLPADAHPLRRQRPQRPRPPQLRPGHGRPLIHSAKPADRTSRYPRP